VSKLPPVVCFIFVSVDEPVAVKRGEEVPVGRLIGQTPGLTAGSLLPSVRACELSKTARMPSSSAPVAPSGVTLMLRLGGLLLGASAAAAQLNVPDAPTIVELDVLSGCELF